MAVNPQSEPHRKTIPTLVKDSALVEEKRRRIVDAAVELFIRKGYHSTTTREIARAAGISIGALYEYVATKEDVLYLVCDAIHAEIESRLRGQLDPGRTAAETLRDAIKAYFEVCDRMQDSILLIYRETASLDTVSGEYVLRNESRITGMFTEIVREGVESGIFAERADAALELTAHNIAVLGHMWAFRRWYLRDIVTLAEYTEQQTTMILHELTPDGGCLV